MASVRFEHINKYFGKVEVVHDINLTVNDHEFVVLVRTLGFRQKHHLAHGGRIG